MATIAVAKTSGQDAVRTYLWEAIVQGSLDGAAIELPDHADRSVQVTGNFSGPATLTMQGRNDGTNWVTLLDPFGNAIAFTAAGIKQIMEFTKEIRPLASGVDGSTDLDVTLYARPTT
ncbi:MAG: hypothetical protein IIB99_07250 [Planctomycetes bacterium]|nr:hypothetical protein [Planctomycetota bacterium]